MESGELTGYPKLAG